MGDTDRKAIKTIIHCLCQLQWVVGVVVGLNGVYLLMKYRQNSLFFTDIYIILPALLMFTSAAFLLVTGCLGSWLSLRDSICLQGLFVYLLVVVFCLESTTGALAYFHSIKLGSEIAPLSGVFQEYTGSSQDLNSRTVDATQEKFQCCGVYNYTDWLETSWFNRSGGLVVPHSCCNTTFPSCNGTLDQPWQLYTEGCHVKMEEAFKFVLHLFIWGSPLLFFLELVLFLLVVQLMRGHRPVKYHLLEKPKPVERALYYT